MNKKLKIGIRMVCFMLIFLLLFSAASRVLRFKMTSGAWNMTVKIQGLRNEPRNSMDVMFFGSSHAYSTFSPLQMMDEHGFTSYVYGTQRQPMWVTYHYMIEALKMQNPELIILEPFMCTSDFESFESGSEIAIDEMPLSLNKVKLVTDTLEPELWAEYLFDIIRFHSRWSELDASDFDTSYYRTTDPQKGYVLLEKVKPAELNYGITDHTETAALSERNREYLEKIIALTKERDITLWIVVSPYVVPEEAQEKYNTVKEIAQSEGIRFLNYNEDYDALGLDEETDFYDGGHVNRAGARKVSAALGEEIAAAFSFPDRRADYPQWSEAYAQFLAQED